MLSLGVKVHGGDFSPDQKKGELSNQQLFYLTHYVTAKSMLPFFATTLTLTLISSPLVERDIFLLKPFPCS